MLGHILRTGMALFTSSELIAETSLLPEELSITVDPTPCTVSVDDGSYVDITYDRVNNKINYKATVKQMSYLALGYGSSMKYTNMIVWQSLDSL
jgi:hypothetical protein